MLISVLMITYGHEKYIRDAIYGVLMQKCNFDVELIIADDCSPDSTKDIISEIIKTHVNGFWIKYTRHNVNKGPARNFIWSLSKVRGKYIAICEGDDYWTDPYKLQYQVEFLEKNPTYSSCFHPVSIKKENVNIHYNYPVPRSTSLTFRDILLQHYVPTCSLFFRKDSLPTELPNWFSYAKMCDIPLELLLANSGPFFYLNKKMAVYRLNIGGITQSREQKKNGRKAYEFIYLNLRRYFGFKYYFMFTYMIQKNKIGKIIDFFRKSLNLAKLYLFILYIEYF